ncbi:hypothetical protein A3E46_00220 [Candidatus Woesebacteria bacterium RIFCSPHIGHO2_12_FULL_46_16]|uniref:Uncharacterized protein n=1 Tax=Candidatus Woesebacteria bacterium RIFCSPHIGHO2_12_FULL_46_16 TaxID=1802513 RepID=A0A1F8AYD8_9BACT|nr:MAG: hypothetical protein A3E46_00220 [Candidatus Woesebacteria bacterium RIFCSPHIGHO2_12_FULL_46_16]
MRERLLGRRNFREIVASLKNRIFGPPTPLPETPAEAPDDRRMWEILNVVPIIELDKLTPQERARLEEKSLQELRAQLDFQASLNKPVSEFFGEKSSPQPAPRR